MVVADLDELAGKKRERIVVTGCKDKVIHGPTARTIGEASPTIVIELTHCRATLDVGLLAESDPMLFGEVCAQLNVLCHTGNLLADVGS